MSVQIKLTINQAGTAAQANEHGGLFYDAKSPHEFNTSLMNYLHGMKAGAYQCNIVAQIGSANASKTVTLTYSGLVADTDILVIGGLSFACRTTPATAGQWAKGANIAASVTNLVAAINTYSTAYSALISATGNTSTGVVTITSTTAGVIGNLIQVTVTAGTGIVAAGATLTGGTDLAVPKTYSFGY
jgi:hypothetical protein